MANGKLERVAVAVDDIHAVSDDLAKVFGIELSHMDVEEMGIKAAVGDDGIELVQKIEAAPRCADHWRGPLAALCIGVDDLDAAEARMEEAGFALVQRVETHGGLRELFYGANFHGLPLVVYERSERSLKDLTARPDDAEPLKVDWL